MRNLEEIEQRASNATQGPWIVVADPFHRSFYAALPDTLEAPPLNVANAEFIANARTDIPALIARIRELEALAEFREGIGKPLTPEQLDRARERALERVIAQRDRWKARWQDTVNDATEQRATIQRVRELCLTETSPDKALVHGAWYEVLKTLDTTP